MVLAVHERDFDVHHGLLGQRATLHALAESCFDGGNELARHRPTDHLVLKDKAGARWQRLDLDLDHGELAATAGLLDQPALGLGRSSDRLIVCDLGAAHFGTDPELAAQAVEQHIQV